MNISDNVKKVVQGSSVGFQIARRFFNWNNLTMVEEQYKSSQVIYLAKLIDEAFEKEKVE